MYCHQSSRWLTSTSIAISHPGDLQVHVLPSVIQVTYEYMYCHQSSRWLTSTCIAISHPGDLLVQVFPSVIQVTYRTSIAIKHSGDVAISHSGDYRYMYCHQSFRWISVTCVVISPLGDLPVQCTYIATCIQWPASEIAKTFNIKLCCFSTNCIVRLKPLKILFPVYRHSTAFLNVIALNYLIILIHIKVQW